MCAVRIVPNPRAFEAEALPPTGAARAHMIKPIPTGSAGRPGPGRVNSFFIYSRNARLDGGSSFVRHTGGERHRRRAGGRRALELLQTDQARQNFRNASVECSFHADNFSMLSAV